jgi:hypothetical protein
MFIVLIFYHLLYYYYYYIQVLRPYASLWAYDRRASDETMYKMLIYIHKRAERSILGNSLTSARLTLISLFSLISPMGFQASGAFGDSPLLSHKHFEPSFRDRIHTYSLRNPNIWPRPLAAPFSRTLISFFP